MDEDGQLEMLHRAAFGKQVDLFMKSDVGQYLLARAADQIYEAQEMFKRADCSKASDVQMLQNKIIVADSIVQWLRDAVGDGIQALNILEDRSE